MQEERQLRRNSRADGVSVTRRRRSAEELAEAAASAHDGNTDLFVYGTLLSDRHVKLILGRHVETEPAVLNNYMRVVPPGAFFFIVRQQGAQVRGRILKALTPEELVLLDAFEDEKRLYYRKRVVVRDSAGQRRRAETYIGNIPALQKSFGQEIQFEDRYNLYLERKISHTLDDISPREEPENDKRAMQELMGSEIDQLIQSHFDGDYVCNYLMLQAFSGAKPPDLAKVFGNCEIKPYADAYMELVCKHIIFNQFAEKVRHEFHKAVRVSHKYFRHGVAILLAFLYYNSNKRRIKKLMRQMQLDSAVPNRSYREYAALCIAAADEIYDHAKMGEIVEYVGFNWNSTPTPLGAELEFSRLGSRAVYAEPGEDERFDSFNWFNDFDLRRRMWRLGGHVDAHRPLTAGTTGRRRGFLEYALGRFNIIGDLSRPLFDCPWAMSMVINEAVKFLEIPTHSLHISMELPKDNGAPVITNRPHRESDLVCLMLLGGDLRRDENGILREWRIFNNELDTNSSGCLNFSDRKHHYSRSGDESSASDVMEYKFLRLRSTETDYAKIIVALKDYQLETCARPITIPRSGQPELPEQLFLRSWAAHPQSLSLREIDSFVSTVERGMCKEHKTVRLDKRKTAILENLTETLIERNRSVTQG